jgi:hypothetical protein
MVCLYKQKFLTQFLEFVHAFQLRKQLSDTLLYLLELQTAKGKTVISKYNFSASAARHLASFPLFWRKEQCLSPTGSKK